MKQTALNQVHRNQGGKMVEFAGYDMPVQYADGMLKEHEWVRGGNVGILMFHTWVSILLKVKIWRHFLSKITPTNFGLSKENLAKYTVF